MRRAAPSPPTPGPSRPFSSPLPSGFPTKCAYTYTRAVRERIDQPPRRPYSQCHGRRRHPRPRIPAESIQLGSENRHRLHHLYPSPRIPQSRHLHSHQPPGGDEIAVNVIAPVLYVSPDSPLILGSDTFYLSHRAPQFRFLNIETREAHRSKTDRPRERFDSVLCNKTFRAFQN